MKEIRITIRGEDFAAVSASLVKLGVGFQVEPVEAAETGVAPAAPQSPRRRQVKRKSTNDDAPERGAGTGTRRRPHRSGAPSSDGGA